MEWDSGCIHRLALGRMGGLGDLYDARRECFTGGSIVGHSTEIPSSLIECRDEPGYEYQIITTNTYSEIFKGLGLDTELKASVLAGLVGLEGSVAFCKDLKKGSRSVRAILKFQVETRYESLEMGRKLGSLMELLPPEHILRWEQATHFVGGVQWGAQAYAAVESERSVHKHAKDIEMKLSAKLHELGLTLVQLGFGAGIGGKWAGKKGKNEMDAEDEFTFRVKADVPPADYRSESSIMLPRNFDEAWAFLSGIPAQVARNTRPGVDRPLWFILYPLSQLKSKLPPSAHLSHGLPLYSSVSSAAVEALERLFNELQSIKQALHDLHEDMTHHACAFSTHHMERIAASRNDVIFSEGQLRDAVCKQILAIRSQTAKAAALEELTRDFFAHSECATPSKAQAFMEPFKCRLRDAIELKKQGVQLLHPETSASAMKSIPMPGGSGASTWAVILTRPERGSKINQQETKNWNTFWHLHAQSRCGRDFGEGNNDLATADIRFYVQETRGDPCKSRVSVFRDGEVVSEDTTLLMEGDPPSGKLRKNLVYSRVRHEANKQAPNARITLQTYCPGHLVQSSRMALCSKDIITDWACETCKHFIDYGKDGFLYCRCGRAPVHACCFRCSRQEHGPLYIAFPANEDVDKILMKQEPRQQLNILLLGETGVGKSTFINAFANYLTFDSLQGAMDSAAGEVVGLIPMAFTHTDPETYEMHEIKFGPSDPNEAQHKSQSATQSCRTYSIHVNEFETVQLIDTPGVGDTRGIEYDQANFENILGYLNNYSEIHGICVLLKPNSARLTVTFRFCIKELLRHLHKSASENIVFLFTNARGTSYRPGDTLPTLQTLLKTIQDSPPHVHIPLNQRTIYCMDNEAFRYLVGSKEGCSFPAEEDTWYTNSWIRSTNECNRMLQHFCSIDPHNVNETVSLNNAWNLVMKLQKPLEDVTKIIQDNLSEWNAMKEELEKFEGSMRELESMYLKKDRILRLEVHPLKKGARTVCTSLGKCCEMRTFANGKIEPHYRQVCHEPCGKPKAWKHLWFCDAMDVRGRCKECNCSHNKHVRVTYDTKLVDEMVNIEGELQNKIEMADAKKAKIAELEQRCDEWQQELEAITKACAIFAHFFKNNAITSYNDDMAGYVAQQISEAKMKHENCRELVDRWEKYLKDYQKQVKELERATTSSEQANRSSSTSPGDIVQLVKSLYKLKQNGPSIEKLALEVSACEQRTVQFQNKTFHVPGWAQRLKARVLPKKVGFHSRHS